MSGAAPLIILAREWTINPLAFTELLIVVVFFAGLFILDKVSARYDREKERAKVEASKSPDGSPSGQTSIASDHINPKRESSVQSGS